ncbi:MAG: DUF359 domain-containing protein [Candidatus Bathyarchaeia archaeon]
MGILYALTLELRIKLKKPLGTLIRGSYTETMKKLLEMIKEEKPSTIISVGDTVSKNIIENQMMPQLAIVDNRVMRKSIQPIPTTAEEVIHVKNPPGTITEEAATAIQMALKSNRHVKIIVDGEEDLLALIAILHAPQNSFVIYGQPYEGIVIVKVTQEKKAEVSEILEAMETVRKTK